MLVAPQAIMPLLVMSSVSAALRPVLVRIADRLTVRAGVAEGELRHGQLVAATTAVAVVTILDLVVPRHRGDGLDVDPVVEGLHSLENELLSVAFLAPLDHHVVVTEEAEGVGGDTFEFTACAAVEPDREAGFQVRARPRADTIPRKVILKQHCSP